MKIVFIDQATSRLSQAGKTAFQALIFMTILVKGSSNHILRWVQQYRYFFQKKVRNKCSLAQFKLTSAPVYIHACLVCTLTAAVLICHIIL